MKIEEILSKDSIQLLLHQVLENQKTHYKDSYFSKQDRKNGYNQYGMLIVVDFLIKYQMIVEDESFFLYMTSQLRAIVMQHENHQELVFRLNTLLGELVRMKLHLTDTVSDSNKRMILEYIYDRYIVHGYCFHSFPSIFLKKAEEVGLDPKQYQYPIEQMKRISYIFDNHRYFDIISKDLDAMSSYLTITDSPAMAYFYTFGSPSYFANLSGMGKYYQSDIYDKEAYYRRDRKSCLSNLSLLCDHVRLTEREKESVLMSFEKQWEQMRLSSSKPCIAYIRRSDINKDRYADIQVIYENSKNEELAISIAKICDSRFSNIRRYSILSNHSFEIHQFPSYEEIKNFQPILKEKLEVKEKQVSLSKITSRHQYVDVIALLGVLLITLGMTVFIFLNYFK